MEEAENLIKAIAKFHLSLKFTFEFYYCSNNAEFVCRLIVEEGARDTKYFSSKYLRDSLIDTFTFLNNYTLKYSEDEINN